jgi:antitoxin component of MazEF toxin-antitoxin module
VGENNGTLTVSIPREVAEAEEIEQGDEIAVGLDTESGELRYVPVEEFHGW